MSSKLEKTEGGMEVWDGYIEGTSSKGRGEVQDKGIKGSLDGNESKEWQESEVL